MPDFKIVNNPSEIPLNNKWIPSTKFNSKDRLVSDYKGCQYRIIEKKERAFSGLERFGRGFLGTLAIICTLCFGLFSKSVRNLFTKSKANIRYAKPALGDNSQIQKKIVKELTPQMVEVLGGIDKVLSFPIIEDWSGEISQKQLTAPVMIGYHKEGPPFLLFCYLKLTKYGYVISGEYLGRKNENSWVGTYSYPSELNLRSGNPILDGSLEEKYMLDKISRLMKGEAIGAVEKFSNVVLTKPEDKISFSPDNAYLKQEELHAYMDLDTLFYEKMPKEKTTEVYLYNQRISKEENINALKKKFPEMARLTLRLRSLP